MLPHLARVAGVVVTCLVTTAPAHAQHDSVTTLDQATFLRLVRERSPRIRVHAERTTVARAAISVSAVPPNPTLGYEREAVPGLDSSDDFVRLGYAVDFAGRRGLAKRAAAAAADAEVATIAGDAFALELDARSRYLAASYARARAEALDARRGELVTVVEALRSRAAHGDASEYDAERVALELELLDDRRASANRELVQARLRLGAILGEPDHAYDARDPLTVPAAASNAIAVRRSEIDAAQARARSADAELVAASRGWIPRLQLMAGLRVSTSMGQQGVGYVLGLSGDLPLFDRGSAGEALARSEARRWRHEAEALSSEARADVELARHDLSMRIDQAVSFERGPRARTTELVRRVVVAFREGDRPVSEVIDVERVAEANALRALELAYEARLAELALARAAGRLP